MTPKDIYEFLRKLILPLDEIDQAFSENAKIVELGCGRGVISIYLSKVKTRQITGVDIDSKSLPQINTKSLNFKKSDIRTLNFATYDGVVISDCLHHLPFDDQNKLLIKIASGLKKGSVLVIKEIDTKELVRSKLSRFWDFVFYAKDKITYWDSPTLMQKLRDLNFTVKMQRATRFFPGSTNLFICTKK